MSAVGGASEAPRTEPLGRLTGLSMGRLAWLQASHRRASAICLGLCLAITVVLPALLPLLDGFALERAVADTATRDGGFTVEQKVSNLDDFGGFRRAVAARVDSRTAGLLLPVTAYASTAPLYPTTLNTDPVPPELAGRAFQASYLDGLANHVEMQAGQLPPDGLGGGETAVTIPQSGADLAGLNLFDRVCLGFSAGGERQSSWCARIVGLWRPLDVQDPFWGGRAPQLAFVMGRYDFFQLANRQPPQGTTAGASYWVDAGALDGARAAQIAETIRALAGELRTPQRRVATRLDAGLLRVNDQHRLVSASLRLFTAELALLGLVVVGLVGVRFLGEQSQMLAVLRARGWPPARTWLQAFAGLAAPTIYGLPIALGACLLVLALVGTAAAPAGTDALGSAQGRTALYTGCVLAGLLVALLATIAASAVWRQLRPSLEGPFRPTWRSRAAVVGLLALLGLAGLLSVRLPAPPSGPWSDALTLAVGTAPAIGALCLAFAAGLLPGPVRVRGGEGVPALLSGWQLTRAPGQHAAMVVALSLTAAASVLAALTLVRAGQVALEPALRTGLEATLGIGWLGSVALLLMGAALHHGSVTRRRLDEYGGLIGHGLSKAQIRRSLALEQAITSGWGLVLGIVLGLLLAVLVLGLSSPEPRVTVIALLGLAAIAVVLLAGMLTVGAFARRVPDRLEPLAGGLET